MAMVAKRMIWTVAPLAYQNGPLTPYLYATAEDCKRVAAQVHELTTAEATSPDFTVLPAVLKTSDVWTSLLYLLSTYVVIIMPKLILSVVFKVDNVPLTYAKRKPSPMMTP